MKLHKNKFINLFNAIVIIAMALLFNSCTQIELLTSKNSLILYNDKQNKIIQKFDISTNDFFSIEFFHSVNKSPVIEYYKINDSGKIVLYKSKYYNFGAGVATDLNDNEIMRYDNDGSMVIENMNMLFDELNYYLSDIYDHKLTINDKITYSLWELCGKNSQITFLYK